VFELGLTDVEFDVFGVTGPIVVRLKLVAFVEDHDTVALPPRAIGFGEMVTEHVGAGGGFTLHD
jgi:hypothetical protein